MIGRIGMSVLLVCMLWVDVRLYQCKHASAQTYKGEAIRPAVATFCIGSTPHDPPCASADIGFLDAQSRLHFTKPIPESEMCEILHRLGY